MLTYAKHLYRCIYEVDHHPCFVTSFGDIYMEFNPRNILRQRSRVPLMFAGLPNPPALLTMIMLNSVYQHVIYLKTPRILLRLTPALAACVKSGKMLVHIYNKYDRSSCLLAGFWQTQSFIVLTWFIEPLKVWENYCIGTIPYFMNVFLMVTRHCP